MPSLIRSEAVGIEERLISTPASVHESMFPTIDVVNEILHLWFRSAATPVRTASANWPDMAVRRVLVNAHVLSLLWPFVSLYLRLGG